MKTSDFEYELPEAAIAQHPAEPRDESRLLDTRTMSDHRFHELATLLDPGDVAVINTTRVRAARLAGRRADTGGKVEILLLRAVDDDRWEALARPSRRLRPGVVVEAGQLTALVESEPEEGRVLITLSATGLRADDIEALIATTGTLPLPPYITTPLEDSERYQTVFSERTGSAAAPTAGLHFTERTIEDLAKREVHVARVELEVGLATFRPVSVEDVADHSMHEERYRVQEEAVEVIESARRDGGRVVAVGTTVVRALESAAAGGSLEAGEANTRLFIRPGYRFRVVDVLVTNFHAPRSSLLILLAAFMGDSWKVTYDTARERGYRFLSFGDAMLAVRNQL